MIGEREEALGVIASTAPIVIWATDADGLCTFISRQWVEITGQPCEAALGKGWSAVIHPEDVGRTWNRYYQALVRRERFDVDYRVRGRRGEYRWVTAKGVPRSNVDGSFAGYIGAALDVTDRNVAAEAISARSRHLLEAEEHERAEIARELHDDINQRLAAVAISLAAVATSSGQTITTHVHEIEHARQQLEALSREVQALSYRLHPSQLEHLGLVMASAAMCSDIARQHEMVVAFDADAIPAHLVKHMALPLYRVLQEALHNAVKHSGATRVHVSLRDAIDSIELTVKDCGRGFDAMSTERNAPGLTSMKERVEVIGGEFVLCSEPGRGTSIRARVPLLRP